MTIVCNDLGVCSCAITHLTSDPNDWPDAVASAEVRSAARGGPWVVLCSGLDESVLERERSGCGTARHVELVEDVADVSRDGLLAEPEFAGYGTVRSARRDQTKDLEFAGGQPRSGPRSHGRRPQTREIERRSKVLKRVAGRIELDIGAISVVESP